ncbi:MAG: hypothetical protein ABMB14_08875 [Myxococcota bacterium]
MTMLGWWIGCGDSDTSVAPEDSAGAAAEETPAAEVARYRDCGARIEQSDAGDVAFQTEDRVYDGWGWLASSAFDYGQDGVFDARTDWTRDRWGNVLETRLTEGEVTVTVFYGAYDADGNPIVETWDDDGDGVPNTVRTWTAEDGRVAEGTTDVDGDGEIDERFTYTYDGLGRVAAITTTPESPAGLFYDDARTYAGDSDAIIGWTLVVRDDDGTVWLDWAYTWTRDELGRVVRLDRTEDGVASDTTYTFDGDGERPASSVETTPEWVVETTYGYDDAWRLVIRDSILGVSGEVHERTTWDCPAP